MPAGKYRRDQGQYWREEAEKVKAAEEKRRRYSEASKKGHAKRLARERKEALEGKLEPPPPMKPKISRHVNAQRRREENGFGLCGAKKRDGTPCRMQAGHGTDHYGLGRCKHHGGNLPTHLGKAVKQRAQLMGAPIDMNPIEAIIWSIRITAGEVKWLSEQIAVLDEKDWYENTVLGKQMHLFVRERRDRVSLLYKMGNDALKLGLAERAIKMAEMYGVALSRFIMGVLDDLNLTEKQAKAAPSIVRKHLILLEGSQAMEPKRAIEEAIEIGEVEELQAV